MFKMILGGKGIGHEWWLLSFLYMNCCYWLWREFRQQWDDGIWWEGNVDMPPYRMEHSPFCSMFFSFRWRNVPGMLWAHNGDSAGSKVYITESQSNYTCLLGFWQWWPSVMLLCTFKKTVSSMSQSWVSGKDAHPKNGDNQHSCGEIIGLKIVIHAL